MASEHSYTISLNNNRTEKVATDYLLLTDDRYWVPDARSRKAILSLLDIRTTLSRAFDFVHVEHADGIADDLLVSDVSTITLVELKTTRKYLPDLPHGFFLRRDRERI